MQAALNGGFALSWSLKIAEIAGTSLRIHFTFFLLLIWAGAAAWPQGAGAAVDAVLFVALVFLCVTLHEFGHVFAARRYGIRTPDITLLPIGGVASLERMPERPREELIVAIAGPLVNVVIAGALYALLGARFDLTQMGDVQAATMSLAGRLAAVNVMLVLFNLIPAFPLDGGRMLRAVLAMRLPRARATVVAARVGQVFAIGLAVLGLLYNPFLALVAAFIFFVGEGEARYETERAAAGAHRTEDAMIRRFETLRPEDTAERAGELLLLTTQQEFPVVDAAGDVPGMVTRKGLIAAMGRSGPQTRVLEFMERELESFPPQAPLSEVLPRLHAHPARAVLVRDADGALLGYVSAENAHELMMLDQARGGPAAQRANGPWGGRAA